MCFPSAEPHRSAAGSTYPPFHSPSSFWLKAHGTFLWFAFLQKCRLKSDTSALSQSACCPSQQVLHGAHTPPIGGLMGWNMNQLLQQWPSGTVATLERDPARLSSRIVAAKASSSSIPFAGTDNRRCPTRPLPRWCRPPTPPAPRGSGAPTTPRFQPPAETDRRGSRPESVRNPGRTTGRRLHGQGAQRVSDQGEVVQSAASGANDRVDFF